MKKISAVCFHTLYSAETVHHWERSMKIYSTDINHADDSEVTRENPSGDLLYWADVENEIFAITSAPALERNVSLFIGKLVGKKAIDDNGATLFMLR